MSVEIRRGSDRFVEREAGRLTQHAFSFGEVLDPDRVSFGPMICHDDHLLGGGRGFGDHPHEGLEIVSWVVSGALVHTGADGASTVVRAGECAVLVAGAGTRHAEVASEDGPCRFVQVWLTPGSEVVSAEPTYAVAPVGAEPGAGLVPAPLPLLTPGATFAVARLAAGETLALPAAARVHAFVATGALLRSSLAEPLSAGDAFVLTDEPSYDITAAVPSELLVWSFA
ncbi:pirin family protein [Nocardioides caeni]|uniref:Cupin domain-containing protein n=1 Tax=Nocardioides caeni TaxID=574700 RepID=A0A4S8MZW7_9ACTN|nr:pirin family protein [Nocardioides caeni]THV09003.1 cupin domain-containing protein [Nocardioides caeni]